MTLKLKFSAVEGALLITLRCTYPLQYHIPGLWSLSRIILATPGLFLQLPRHPSAGETVGQGRMGWPIVLP